MRGYDIGDTIVAAATALAPSAIGVVRMSGFNSWDIARAALRGLPEQIEPRRAYVCSLPLPGSDVLDTAVAVFWRAPLSYTGEHSVEINMHGNPLLLRHVVELLASHGARHAEAGEFTYRAYLQGKLDLAQAEAVSELIHAGSARALALAGAQLAGLPGKRVQQWLGELLRLTANVEVIHDYAADDLDASLDPEQLLTPLKLDAALAELISQMDEALEASRRAAPLRSGLTVALCGPPNVGKSTLFNALLGHERALTAPEPGTTRDYLAESLDAGGLKLTLVDTAGYRDAADAVEAAGVRRTGEWARAADVLLWVEAADAPGVGLPEALADLQPLRVTTRCDLLPGWPDELVGTLLAASETDNPGQADAASSVPTKIFHVSGTTGRGVPELWTALSALPAQLGEPALDSFGVRQAQAVQQARDALQRARDALARDMPLDAAVVDIYAAADALHGVFEQHDRARVIEQIFSGFCVGK